MRYLALGLLVLLPAAIPAHAQSSRLPEIRTNGAVKQLFVDGQPYVMLGGELHNSSASSVTYMQPIWSRLAALHLNTVIGTVNWELLEPEEGKFDFTLVDAQIQEARRHDMRLVLIWFASWKNATSTYVPMWVKTDTRRFPRMVTKPRPDLPQHLASLMGATMPAPNLTPLGEESAAADAKAFAALMRHIRQVDPQHTVVMMQVENESGLLGDSRDRSPLAEAAWAKPVPASLMDYLVKNKASLLPEMQKVWGVKGYKTSGTWAEVFGTDNFADEVFMAWHVGRYINRVVEAGKAELALPMYVNAWLGPQPQMDMPGQYPSGGPVARVMDVYRAAGPAIDLLAPDIYVQDFKGTCALYNRSGNPLFIPEARAIAGNLFWALGQHAAMGFSPFGIEDVKEDHQLAEAYGFLKPMLPILAKAQAEKKILGVLIDGDESATMSMAGYKMRITSSRARIRLDAGQAPPDAARKQGPAPAPGFGPPPPDTRPFGFVISSGPDEFLVVGSGLMITFSADSPGPKIAEIGSIDEGSFENGHWVAGRRLNGDEGRPVLRAGRIGAIKVKLYRRD
ncbi:DUF5597 domain-containing protein [uncultured Paludibaculum sp.]|uniref:GH35 family beta-galactosidase n=1 Tax=uncultured Paludibaculum sp. TaxID=1765020 RepID=UPI002AAAE142|nr:DUF5597 domain-containing protein [uncultured Paludibaculum sp.]